MEIIVGSVKAFVRLCNTRDFSHLPYIRLVEWPGEWSGRSNHGEEVFEGDESEGIVEEDSDEESSSAEDSCVSQSQKRRKEKKRLDKRKRTEPLLFELEMYERVKYPKPLILP